MGRLVGLAGLLWAAVSTLAQSPSYVSTQVTGYAGAPGVVNHPRYLFQSWEATGGVGVDEAYRHFTEVSADLRNGRMEGVLEVNRPGLPPASANTGFRSHFLPRYRVERAPGNTSTDLIPVEWEVFLKEALFNYTGVASGTEDFATLTLKPILSVSVWGQGTTEAEAAYPYQSRVQGTAPFMDWSAEREFRTRNPPALRTELVTDPVTGKVLLERHIAVDGAREAEISHPPNPASRNSFGGVRLRVRHTVRPGNGLLFSVWFRVEADGRVSGAGAAARWRKFDLRYRVPEGYRIVADDGQDLSGLRDGSLPSPPADWLPITGWSLPDLTGKLALSFGSLEGMAMEVQRTRDFRDWTTVRRIDPGPGDVPVVVELPAGSSPGQDGDPEGYYRVVVPRE